MKDDLLEGLIAGGCIGYALAQPAPHGTGFWIPTIIAVTVLLVSAMRHIFKVRK